MVKNHLKRHASPTSWAILRKENKYILKPRPGPHPRKLGMPLTLLLKKQELANTTKEVKKLLNIKNILVDGSRKKDHKLPIGLMDIIEVKEENKFYKILIDTKGRLTINEISQAESKEKTCKVIGKTKLKGKKTQLNLYDGKNILITKDEYKVGDSVLLSLPDKKIKKVLKLENGASAILTGGKHIGSQGTIEEINGKKIIFQSKENKFETLKEYAFVVKK